MIFLHQFRKFFEIFVSEMCSTNVKTRILNMSVWAAQYTSEYTIDKNNNNIFFAEEFSFSSKFILWKKKWIRSAILSDREYISIPYIASHNVQLKLPDLEPYIYIYILNKVK